VATFDEAARHVKGCPACQTAVRRREKFDERVGQLTRDVPVPSGLRDRLLAQLESGPQAPKSVTPVSQSPASPLPTPQSPAPQPAVRSRRRMIVAAVAASVMAILSVGIWKLALSRPSKMSMDEIAGYALSEHLVADDLPVFAQFSGGRAAQLPKTTGKFSDLAPFRRLVDPQLADREVAIYFFTLVDRNRRKYAGRLVMIPLSLVKDPPAATTFSGGTTVYTRGYCTTAWVEDGFVYVCCIQEGGEGELHLLRPLRNAPA
jgi:hypothetical protein